MREQFVKNSLSPRIKTADSFRKIKIYNFSGLREPSENDAAAAAVQIWTAAAIIEKHERKKFLPY